MDRLRSGLSEVVLWIGAGIGGAIGGALGLVTERGFVGIITVAAAIAGTVAGIYVAQLIVSAPADDEP